MIRFPTQINGGEATSHPLTMILDNSRGGMKSCFTHASPPTNMSPPPCFAPPSCITTYRYPPLGGNPTIYLPAPPDTMSMVIYPMPSTSNRCMPHAPICWHISITTICSFHYCSPFALNVHSPDW